ncbi:VanW family protein [Candidatus Peregrinibacteria bacterium]|nr:VanW family protein [Candidatus Peregrinibacteria bacterium]
MAKSGYEYEDDPAQKIAEALKNDTEETIAVRLRAAPGRINNESLEELGDLVLLASGRSDFAGSGEGRKANIRKGLTKYIHNSMVEPGQEFSINAILKHVPIKEWEMALGIFGGGILRPVAGGGLCQVATTLYRGILNAGFPVTQRSNHSLFVHYYEKYGVGIDSTIFPGSAPDLRFINDTASPLLIQAYVEDAEATVNIYGTPDGRTVRMTGPYFAENAPEEFRVNGRKLSSREIAWVRDVTRSDGIESRDVVLSRYKTIPRSVVREHARTLATVPANVRAADLLRMHAAAGEKESVAQEPALDMHARVQ